MAVEVSNSQIVATVTDNKVSVTVPDGKVSATVSSGAGLSGVVTVSPPLVNSGTGVSAVLGLSVGAGLGVVGGSLALASHAANHGSSGSDPITVAVSQVTGLQAALDAKAASSHTHVAASITDFTAAVVAAAPPTTDASLLTAGTLPDQRLSGNIARTSDVSTAVANLVNSAPSTLDTLKELSDALGADANFSTTVTNALAGKVATSDARLTDAREWSADTVSQAEAEAGTATTRRAWTATRVFQAIAAWWAASAAKTKLDGIASGATANQTDAYLLSRANHTGTQAHTTITGLGTAATSNTGDFATASHAHGSITNAGAIGTTGGLVITTGASGLLGALAQGTAGQVLKVNSGATGVEWGAAAADVSIDATAADVLSASSGSIAADDPGADRLVFWDDSAGKLTYLSAGTNITIADTTISAAGSTSASDLNSGTLADARLSSNAQAAINLYLWSAFR